MSDVQINFLLSLQSAAYLFMGVQEPYNEFLSCSSREIRRGSVFVFEFLNLVGTFSVFEVMKSLTPISASPASQRALSKKRNAVPLIRGRLFFEDYVSSR